MTAPDEWYIYDARNCDSDLLTEWFHLLFRKNQTTSRGRGSTIMDEDTRGNIFQSWENIAHSGAISGEGQY